MCAGCRDDAALPRSNISRPRPGAAATYARLQFARRAAWPSRARCALRLSLPAWSWPSWSREIDNLATRSQIASTASAGPCRRTRRYLSGLSCNEIVDVGVGEHPARTLHAVTDDHVAERTRSDVAVERLHRAMELARGLARRAQAVGRWGNGRFRFLSALAVGELGEPCQTVAPIVRNEDARSDRYICDIRGLGHARRSEASLDQALACRTIGMLGRSFVHGWAYFTRADQSERQFNWSRVTLAKISSTVSTNRSTKASVISLPQHSRSTARPCVRAIESKSRSVIRDCRKR